MIRVHRTCEGCGRKFTQDHTVGEHLRAFCDQCLDAGRECKGWAESDLEHVVHVDGKCEGSDIEALERTQHIVR